MSTVENVPGTIPKPRLRGMFHAQVKRHLIAAGILTVISGVVRYYVNEKKKKDAAEFYRTYDIEAECERIRKLGIFDSCNPDD